MQFFSCFFYLLDISVIGAGKTPVEPELFKTQLVPTRFDRAPGRFEMRYANFYHSTRNVHFCKIEIVSTHYFVTKGLCQKGPHPQGNPQRGHPKRSTQKVEAPARRWALRIIIQRFGVVGLAIDNQVENFTKEEILTKVWSWNNSAVIFVFLLPIGYQCYWCGKNACRA